MSKPDTSTMSDDEKLDYYRKAGIIQDEGEGEGETPEVPPTPAKVEKKDDDDETPSDPVVPTEKKPDPVVPDKKPDENPTPASPSQDGTEKSSKNEDFKPRPSKYIPLAQYQDEKKIHNEQVASLQAKIDELSSATKKEVTVGTEEHEQFIQEYAEKYGIEEEDVRKLVAMVTPKQVLPPEVSKMLETFQTTQDQLALIEEEKHFNVEFEKADPVVQQYFPGLTPEQGKALRQSVFELSHTKEWHDRDLEYVLWKNKDALLAELPKVDTEPVKAPKGKVAETGRSGNHVHKVLTAEDFKDGKTSFEELGNLEESDRNKIIQDMDPQTYRKFVTFAGTFENGGGLKVNRGGKTVILK